MRQIVKHLAVILMLTGCGASHTPYGGDDDSGSILDQEEIGFADIQRVFEESNCMNCHKEGSQSGIDLSTYDKVLNGTNSLGQPLVVIGLPGESALYHSLVSGMMPPRGPLEGDQIQIVERWIAEGALN